MTYAEVIAAQAEVVAAYTRVPDDGWREVSVDDLRNIHGNLTKDLQSAEGRMGGATYNDLKMQRLDAEKTLSKVEGGARAFMVRWSDGMFVFAATKVRDGADASTKI